MIVGLVLAAGSGSRLGMPKALVELHGERLVDRAVRTLRAGGCADITVVLGAAEVEVPGATVVHNPDWATGMGSSLRVGLAALPDDAGAVVISLVDQPQIGPDVVARLIAAHVAGAAVAVATYAGKRRNPALFARSTWADAAATAVGDQGARGYFSAHPETVTAVPCDDLGDPVDIDTPADLARFTDEKGAE
ncbi:MAG TPA: nucleotidyltransferase family protein [Sporichthyaceae bacterium]